MYKDSVSLVLLNESVTSLSDHLSVGRLVARSVINSVQEVPHFQSELLFILPVARDNRLSKYWLKETAGAVNMHENLRERVRNSSI